MGLTECARSPTGDNEFPKKQCIDLVPYNGVPLYFRRCLRAWFQKFSMITRHYLRAAPVDPVTGSAATWVVVPPRELDQGGVFDIRSGAPGNGKDGTAYRDW